MKLATPVLSDAATLTADNETLPVANLQTKQPTKVWRSNNLSVNVVADLGGDYSIDLFALMFSNATADATWRIRAAAEESELTADPAYDTGPMTFAAGINGQYLIYSQGAPETYSRTSGYHTFLPKQFRWWRADIFDPDNADGYLDFGRLYIADSFTPQRTFSYGWTQQWMDGQVRDKSLGNQTYPQERNTYRRISGQFRWQSESDMYGELYQLQRKRGSSKDVLLITDELKTDRLMDWSVYGLMTDIEPITGSTFRLYETTLTIEEMI
jgi:hypothetical protein